MNPITPDERAYLDSLPARSRRNRAKPKPGRPEDLRRENIVCFLSTCVTESEMDAFEVDSRAGPGGPRQAKGAEGTWRKTKQLNSPAL